MGIENFFNTIIKNNISSDLLIIDEKIDCNYLYIDFNSILYILSQELEREINYYLYSIIINENDEFTKKIEEKYNIKFINIDEFNNYFSQNKINDIIKINIYSYIQNICKNLLNSDTLEKLYISIDGTPTMSKIVEQKKRRYMNYVVSKLKKDIYIKYATSIPRDKQIFYDNYKSFNRGNMLSWGNYMQEIYNYLVSSEYKITLYEMCINLKDIIISSSYEFGEGEKKIMEDILHNKKKGSYIIFSPDSDVVLLSLLMQNKLSKINIDTNFNLLRYDQIHQKIENISICNLKKNILDYIYDRMNTYRKYNHNKNYIIDDIIGLFTIFGNDFLPKIESINIKTGFAIIFDLYAKHLNWCRSPQYNLLFEENGITKINYDVLDNIFCRLADFEDKILYDKYISTEYKNYKYLSNILEVNHITPFFIDRLNRYCHGYNKIIRHIKQYPNSDPETIYDNIIYKFTDREQWEREFIKIENIVNVSDTLSTKEIIINMLQKMIDKISVGDIYKCGLKLIKYSDIIDDRFHTNCIKDNLLHPQMIIDDYDKEIYKFDKRMDKYKNIGIDMIDKIGLCEVKYKDCEYKIHVDKNIDDKKYYFYNKILLCNSQRDIDDICKEYLRGFFWTIDFYFNKNNRLVNINNVSTWFYKYEHAPFFKDISEYISSLNNNRNVELNRIYYSITDLSSSYFVKAGDFMNKFEQYMYITPKEAYSDLPAIYKEIINDESIFMDLDKIIQRISNGENHLLDTYNVKFINKGSIIGLRDCDYNKFMNKLINLRKFLEN